MEEVRKTSDRDETKNIFMAVILVVLYLAKKDGVDIKQREALFKYCKRFQEQLLRQKNNSRENLVQSEGYYSNQQNEIPMEQQLIVTDIQDLAYVSDHSQKIDSKDGNDDEFEGIFEEPRKISETTFKNHKLFKKIPEISIEMTKTKESNIKFAANFVSLCDEIEINSSNSPYSLLGALFDEAEPSVVPGSKTACTVKEKDLTEDSGYDTSEGRAGAKHSLEIILDDIKHDIDVNTEDVVDNWKGSLVEHVCNQVMDRSLHKSIESSEIIHNFIIDLLQDIWSDMGMNQNVKWSQKMSIVKKLLKTLSVCQEVLNFTMDVLDDVSEAIRQKCSIPLMPIKAALFLELLVVTVRTIKVLIKWDTRVKSDKDKDVTKLWQKRFCTGVSSDDDVDFIQEIKTDITPKLDKFLITTMDNEPLLSLLAKEALDELKGLHYESQMSQDSLVGMY